MSLIRFKQLLLETMTLTIGDKLTSWSRDNLIFVKVTRKGFNILDLNTNRMILKHHLYGVGMGGKEYPKKGAITVKVRIPVNYRISKVSKNDVKAS